MVIYPVIAWLYWNPPRDLFTIPFIDHPVRIYGVCFVTGFIISYFILAWMFKKKLLLTSKIQERDIASWSILVKHLQMAIDHSDHPAYFIVQKIDKKTRHEIMKLQCSQEPNNHLKSAILHALNESPLKLSRSRIEELFPQAIITATQWGYILTDRLTWFVVLGTIIGARLGDVLFYDWPRYQDNPIEIFMVWKGGLASHGGVLGVILGVYLYYRWVLKQFPEISFVGLMDLLAVPSGLVAFFIRIGNFFNQEILGPPTKKPWGIIFGDPVDFSPPIPRHPTQLYEAVFYLFVFALLMYLWTTRYSKLKTGILSGLLFVAIFGFRFLIEFIKTPQSLIIDETFLQMGQYLSIPFVILGLYLIAFGQKWETNQAHQQ